MHSNPYIKALTKSPSKEYIATEIIIELSSSFGRVNKHHYLSAVFLFSTAPGFLCGI